MKFHHPILKKPSLSLVLLLAAVVAFILTLIKITSFLEASARAQNLVKRAVQDEPVPHDSGQTAAASWAVAEQLKKNNLFSPPAPPRHPVTSVLGILGNEVLIGDRWYKAGDNVADAKVVSVEPTQVRVRWQGRETIFVPMETESQPASDGSRSIRRDIGQSNQDASPTPGGTPSRRPARAAVSRSPRSERTLAQNRAKSNIEASKKPQLSAEKPQYQKVLKQNLKAPKNETATKKTGSDAGAGKKAAAAEIKKSAGQRSR